MELTWLDKFVKDVLIFKECVIFLTVLIFMVEKLFRDITNLLKLGNFLTKYIFCQLFKGLAWLKEMFKTLDKKKLG